MKRIIMAMAGLAMIMMATQWQYVHNPDGNYDNSMTCLQWSWRDYEEIIAAQNDNTAIKNRDNTAIKNQDTMVARFQ